RRAPGRLAHFSEPLARHDDLTVGKSVEQFGISRRGVINIRPVKNWVGPLEFVENVFLAENTSDFMRMFLNVVVIVLSIRNSDQVKSLFEIQKDTHLPRGCRAAFDDASQALQVAIVGKMAIDFRWLLVKQI